MTSRGRKVFALLSLALLLGDAILVGISYSNSQQLMQQSIEEQGLQLHAGYDVAYAATLSNMLQMATFIANDPQIQQRFLQGVLAVEREGGGAGGERAKHQREALLSEVGPAWKRMTERFDVRQLHFHLSPGSTSFLRVHKPEKYGDNMDTVRYTVVDTNRELSPRTGFETGRVYSGLRGVVPMWAEHNGERVHTGALEVGTSFTEILQLIDRQLDVGAAVLLKQPHVEQNMWPSAIEARFSTINEKCRCAIEASTRSELDPILDYFVTTGVDAPFERFHSDRIRIGQRHLAVTHWPLYDYFALSRQTNEPVGAVLLWRDISEDVAALNNAFRENILIAIISFLLLELLLYFSVRMITRQLEAVVSERTEALDRANNRLAQLASTDELTGLHNRRHFMELLETEVTRAQRTKEPLVLAMADLDHFKLVNDRFGHTTGDHALQVVSATLRKGCRSYDILGRYGGEELMLLLPQTSLAEAVEVLERLRRQVESLTIEAADGHPVQLTVSIGVAVLKAGQGATALIDAADKLLYEAKAEGRNRLALPTDADSNQ